MSRKQSGASLNNSWLQILPLAIVLAGTSSCDNAGPEKAAALGKADLYSVASGMPLRRAAPGVLSNDAEAGIELTAQLISEPRYGDLDLGSDGSFTYLPNYKFAGHDSFRYQVSDGKQTSEPVTVEFTYPNVVVILVDDLGLGDLSMYGDVAALDTPNLDALANAGMKFSHAHAPAAVCSPSRYSVLTGNYPYRGRLSSGVWNSYEPSTMLIPGQATLGNIFDDVGYRTAFIGKMHNGSAFWNKAGTEYTKWHEDIDFTRPFDRGPMQMGFDYSFLLPGGVSSRMYAYFENDRLVRFDPASSEYKPFDNNDDAHQRFVRPDKGWKATLNGGLIGAPGWAMDNFDSRKAGSILTRKALKFIEGAINNTPPEPFFLFFAPPQIHVPYSPPDYFNVTDTNDMEPATDGAPVAGDSGISARTDMIREIDLMVGAITDYLREQGQLDNTLIVFSSDNGPAWGAPEAGLNPAGTENGTPLRGFKGVLYEGGHRVPLIARWGDSGPGQSMIQPGTSSSELLGLQDFAATFYALLGQQRPVNQANDSKSFLPVLLGTHTGATPLRDHLIVQGSPQSAYDDLTNVMDRALYKRDANDNLWKLSVVSSNSDPVAELAWKELYNLTADPGETNNVINDPDQQEWLAAMQAEYLELIVKPQTIVGFR